MPFYEIIAIAIALAMDAFAVSIATGVCMCFVNVRQVLRMALAFGLFQAGMPILGWLLGLSVRSFVDQYAHWLAFSLLVFIGAKMLLEAFQDTDPEDRCDPTQGGTLILLAVATSIDALAVGLSFSVLGISVWYPAAVIGVVAFGFTILGLRLGCRVSQAERLKVYAEVLGGLVLIGIGLNILRVHGVFGAL